MKNRIVLLLIALAFLFIAPGSLSESATATLQEMYAEAELKMATGDYAGAADIFEKMGSYSDCSQMAMYCKAISAAEDLGLYEIAIDAFEKLGEFKDCSQMVVYYKGRFCEAGGDVYYKEISTCSEGNLKDAEENYEMAAHFYGTLALFKDSLTRLNDCNNKKDAIVTEQAARVQRYNENTYAEAQALEEQGSFEEAIQKYELIKEYEDSKSRITICWYNAGIAYRSEGKWDLARNAFTIAGDYSDAEEQISITYYEEGKAKQKAQDWDGAIDAFVNAGNYSDANTQISETKYLQAETLE